MCKCLSGDIWWLYLSHIKYHTSVSQSVTQTLNSKTPLITDQSQLLQQYHIIATLQCYMCAISMTTTHTPVLTGLLLQVLVDVCRCGWSLKFLTIEQVLLQCLNWLTHWHTHMQHVSLPLQTLTTELLNLNWTLIYLNMPYPGITPVVQLPTNIVMSNWPVLSCHIYAVSIASQWKPQNP